MNRPLLRVSGVHLHNREGARTRRKRFDHDAHDGAGAARSGCVWLTRRRNDRLTMLFVDLQHDSNGLISGLPRCETSIVFVRTTIENSMVRSRQAFRHGKRLTRSGEMHYPGHVAEGSPRCGTHLFALEWWSESAVIRLRCQGGTAVFAVNVPAFWQKRKVEYGKSFWN